MSTPDNVHIVVTNSQVWGSSAVNFSHNSTCRVDIVVGIGYEDNIDKAMDTIVGVISGDSRTQGDPKPMVAVTDLGDNSVNFTVRVWCNGVDYWGVKFDMTKAIKEAFDGASVNIP